MFFLFVISSIFQFYCHVIFHLDLFNAKKKYYSKIKFIKQIKIKKTKTKMHYINNKNEHCLFLSE